MAMPIYETTLNILREAGFVLETTDEDAVVEDNKVRLAHGNLISPTATDAIVTADDIYVQVGSSTGTVTNIDAVKGILTLSAAPGQDDVVKVKYFYSPVSVDFVEINREDVECAINAKMKGVDSCAPYTAENMPYCVRMITRLWTAGLLLSKSYGYVTDDALEAKDGYKKIEEAKSLLQGLYEDGGACKDGGDTQIDNHGGTGAVLADDDGDMFKKPRSGYRCETDLEFNIC